jgi:hypothetical protein
MQTLRNFLYLDSDSVSNYLSTIEGYIETEVDESEGREGKVGAEGGVGGFKGGGETSKSTARTRKLAVTDEARFQRLYQLLDDERAHGIPYLTSLDSQIWTTLSRGGVVEIQAKARLPSVFQAMSAATSVRPYIEVMEALGENIGMDVMSNQAMQSILAISEATKDKQIPVFFTPVQSSRDSVFCNLSRKYLRSEINEVTGEITVFGKIIRLIPKGSSESVFTLLPELQNLVPANRKERRRLESQKDGLDGLVEKLKGPAVIVHPIALFR